MVALISMILLKLTSEWSCDLFFLPKGYVDGALFTIIVKKKWHADLLQRRWGQTQKEPSCFSMELIAVLVTDFNENYAENHLFPNGNLVPRGRGCPNGSSQQNWKRKQYKSMETEPLSLINWTKNWTTKLRNWSKVAEITTPKTDQYPFF